MSYREEHPFQFRSILVVCVTVVLLAVVGAWYGTRTTEIEAEKTVETTEITEAASVEQTEERSQFWQKLVPWGKDETETADEPSSE